MTDNIVGIDSIQKEEEEPRYKFIVTLQDYKQLEYEGEYLGTSMDNPQFILIGEGDQNGPPKVMIKIDEVVFIDLEEI
jgi:hypothetical protein